MKKLILLSGLFIPVLFVMSCQQELLPPPEVLASCKIDMGYYYGGSGGINDSVLFTYVNGKVDRAEGRDEYVLYGYTGNNITTEKTYEKPGNIFISVDSIQYDNSNRITKISTWEYPSSSNFDTINTVYNFVYQGTAINKVVETEVIPNAYYNVTNYLFTTGASGNIDRIYIADDMNTVFDSIVYHYNAAPNYFKLVHPHFFLFDPFFQLHVGLVPHFPYFYSQNNVTSFTIYSNVDYSIEYGLDSLNHVTSVDMGGFDYMKYRYSCQ